MKQVPTEIGDLGALLGGSILDAKNHLDWLKIHLNTAMTINLQKYIYTKY